jgi:hypothetical protein
MSMDPRYNHFKDYPGRYFVETGSYRGDAIQLAKDAGFKHIRSIDNDPENTKFCKHRFDLFRKPTPDLRLYTGDSAEGLWSMIQDIYEPICFWLDAHSQWFDDEPVPENPFPLLKELHQIGMHPIKTHTILIDDILILTHPDVTGWDRVDIINAIKHINPAYQFKLVANPVRNNMLIAFI